MPSTERSRKHRERLKSDKEKYETAKLSDKMRKRKKRQEEKEKIAKRKMKNF